MSRSRKITKRAVLWTAALACAASVAALGWLARPGDIARTSETAPAARAIASPHRSAALQQLEERSGEAARAGYLPARLVDHPEAGGRVAAVAEVRRDLAPPRDPHRARPAMHNPGGVDGDRPPRALAGGEP